MSAIVLAAYLLQGYLDALRARMLARIGALFDTALQEPIYAAISGLPLKGMSGAAAQQPLRDLELVRAFLSGMGPTAFLDMPWIPIFLLALFLFHPTIGVAATAGAALIVATTLIAERQSKKFAISAVERGAKRAALADAIRRNAEVILALGMRDRFMHQWCQLNEAHIVETTRMRDVEAEIGAIAKILRYVLQSAVLGIGAALVLAEQASGGIMIASSIMMGRALAPIEIVLGTWKQLNAARHAVKRLSETLPLTAVSPAPAITLPRPPAHLVVRDLTVEPPGSTSQTQISTPRERPLWRAPSNYCARVRLSWSSSRIASMLSPRSTRCSFSTRGACLRSASAARCWQTSGHAGASQTMPSALASRRAHNARFAQLRRLTCKFSREIG